MIEERSSKKNKDVENKETRKKMERMKKRRLKARKQGGGDRRAKIAEE